MKSHWVILLLLLAVATVQSNDQLNPCDYKTCSGNEVCHVIENRLLEFPVALCVLPDDKAPESVNGGTDCKTVTSGTNILNCKTEEEWTAGGEGACADISMNLRSTEVKHVCHDASLRRYLQADYVCCPSAQEDGGRGEGGDKKHPTSTPPVLTATPPGAPTPPSQDKKESDKAHTAQPTPTSSSSSSSTSTVSPTPTETSVSLSGEDVASASSYIVPVIIVLAIAFLVLIVSYLIYKKKKKSGKDSASNKPIDATVLVNPLYDGTANYPDPSNYTEEVPPSPLHEDSN